MNIGERLHGFCVTDKKRIPELGADLYVMRHTGCGARLVFIDREDENMTFSISFRTPPKDSTGVFHILEHSVLCGSRKFPVKDPFVELLKGSLNTFLNAMTFQDKTMYPVASRNSKDFYNLVDIYMDAVLHPLAVSEPWAFYQEGWHYEIDNDGNLSYKGVVLNEMLGDYSSPESVCDRYLHGMLYEGTPYAEDSGGDPEFITSLTYDGFVAAHKKYYHPSVAELFLDGTVDLDMILPLLDSYLSEYGEYEGERVNFKKASIDAPKFCSAEYEIPEGQSGENKLRVAVGYLVSTFEDTRRLTALSVLFSTLFSNNEAPGKKKILDTGICEDFSVSLHDGVFEPSVTVEFINVKNGREGECEQLFYDVVCEFCRNGIDGRLLSASLNAIEFKQRERDFGSLPLGIVNAMISLETLLYSDDPLGNLCYEGTLRFLRECGAEYYIEVLKDTFLDNSSRATLVMLPSSTLGKRRAEEREEKLKNVARDMSEDERNEILRINERLHSWQDTEDSPEALERLPRLSISDISEGIKEVPSEYFERGGYRALHQDITTSGIDYADLYFDVSDVCADELAYYYILSTLLGNLATERHSALELAALIKENLGGFDVRIAPFTDVRSGETRVYFNVGASALVDKADMIAQILGEILNETLFDDDEAIRKAVKQSVIGAEESFASVGHALAVNRSAATVSIEAAVKEYYSGYESYVVLKSIDSDFDNRRESVKAKLKELLERSVCRERLLVGITGPADVSLFDSIAEIAKEGVYTPSVCKISTLPKEKEAIIIPAQVAFSAKSYNIGLLNEEPTGSFDVIRGLVGYEYLWSEIRVKGGAYGAGMVVGISGNLSFYSYRDPSPQRSLEKYLEVPDFLRRAAKGDIDITKYIIGAIGDAEPVRTPRTSGTLAISRFLRGISYELRLKNRRSVLNTDPCEIERLANIIERCLESGSVCVIGGREKIEPFTDYFDKVIEV